MEQWMQLRFIVRGIGHRAATILGVKHRNTFCTFCRCHRDRARFDQVWVPATGLSSGLGRGDTIAATGLGAWPRRNLNS